MKRVLLTGADGFLGSNIARELLKRGYAVRAFVEVANAANSLRDLDIETIRGDILNLPDLLAAMPGCSYVIHAAARTAFWPARSEKTRRTNIEGTYNVIRAALTVEIERIVHVGTASSLGYGSKESPGDEDRPYKCYRFGLDYYDSKYQAQQQIRKAVDTEGLPAVIVNPTFMVGPFDSKPTSGAMILAIAKGKIPGIPRGGRNYIYVKDAAKGVVNALEEGRIGECYIIGNKNLSFQEIFSLIAEITGAKKPTRAIPTFVVTAYSLLSTFFALLARKPPMVSVPVARLSNTDFYFSAQKAISELDLPQTPIEIAIRDAYDWLKSNGY